MTNSLEAGIKERLSSPNDIKMYDILINILDDSTKSQIISPFEENSYITEYKASYLLYVLLNKNEKVKEYLFTKLNIKDFIERKAASYKELALVVIEGIKNKDGFTDAKVNIINEMIRRFFEFCYNLMVNDSEKITLFYRSNPNFNSLLELINSQRTDLGISKEFDVFNWIKRLYRDSIVDIDTYS